MKHTKRLWFFLSLWLFFVSLKAQANIPCATFPSVAQSHTTLAADGWLAVYGSSFIQQDMNGSQPLVLGFTDQLSTHSNSCHNGRGFAMCQTDINKTVAPLPSWPTFQVQGLLNVINTETILGAQGECETHNPTECSYGNVNIENGILTLHPGTYWFNDIVFSGSSTLKIKGPGTVRLYAGIFNLNRASSINTNEVSSDNFILMLTGDGTFSGNSQFNAHIYAKERVILADSVKLSGAITSKNLRLSHDFVQLIGQSRCFSNRTFQLEITPLQTSSNICSRIPVTFHVKDERGYLQTDVSGNLTATIKNSGAGCWSTTQTGGACTAATTTVPLSHGRATLWLENKVGGDVNVTASFHSTLTGDLLPKKDGIYRFLPSGFMFTFPSTNLVAGKNVKLSIEAVGGGCQSNQAFQSYDGVKLLQIGEPHYITPAYSAGNPAPLKPVVNNSNLRQTISVTFVNGFAKEALNVTYSDAGIISIPVKDVTPLPPVSQEINEINKPSADLLLQQSEPLSGQAVLTFRPYTFAICPFDVNKGASLASDVFSVAGMPFSLSLKPVVWMNGDQNNTLPVTLNETFCNRAMTPSFSHQNATGATVKINNTALLLSPTGGADGFLSGTLEQSNTAAVEGAYRFTDLTLDEVGSFTLTSGLLQNYLGMTVNPGLLTLGRFYPSHFEALSRFIPGVPPASDTKNTGFTYMGQPFSLEYSVQAMTVKGGAVKNYHFFTGSMETATFEDWVINPTAGVYPYSGLSLNERWKPRMLGTWSSSAAGLSEFRIFGNNMTLAKGSKADGPFSVRFAVGVKDKDRDGTDFKFCANETQLDCVKKVQNVKDNALAGVSIAKEDFLFGLMRMTGFTETENFALPQQISVGVEIFENGTYQVNLRDNYSMISTNIAKKVVLRSDTANPLLQAQISLEDGTQGSKAVINGRASFSVQAVGDKNKEQFLYTLMLGEQKSANLRQLWLQHDWQGAVFNENPSALGTYGFYRGSDRIIYRGEKNIALAKE